MRRTPIKWGLALLGVSMLLTLGMALVQEHLVGVMEESRLDPDTEWVVLARERYDATESEAQRRRLVLELADLIEANQSMSGTDSKFAQALSALFWSLALAQGVAFALFVWGLRSKRQN